MRQQLTLGGKMQISVKWINELVDIERNSDNQLFIKDKERNISLLLKEFNRERNLDPKLVESLAKAKSKGYESWQEAKEKSDFKSPKVRISISVPHISMMI